jgi:hypothetical protein
MSWLAIEFPKLVLCCLKDLQLRWRKLPAGAVDVEVSIDIAEAKRGDFRRSLLSADRFKDSAILWGSSQEKTPGSRSRALLVSATC